MVQPPPIYGEVGPNGKVIVLRYLETKSFSLFSRLSDRFPQRNWPFPIPPVSLPRSQPSFVLLPMQDKTEGEYVFFLQRLRTSTAGPNSSPWIVPHLSLFGAPSLVLLLPFLSLVLDVWARPDSWVSVKFLHGPIPRKRSGSTPQSK